MQDFHILEPNEEPKQIKCKNKPRIKPISEAVAEMDKDIILERIADVEKEIKKRKVRESKPKPQTKPEMKAKPELEPTQIIFIKGPIILDFEDT